ncbi:PP2C family serine/threonine-protein phosphatase [Frankia sp. AvcI1]|uniref:PP2C family protein-serine/threonine phosphatase n=1 Tax=Frankia sp. AvcI1 TaxID=573496 RepID=UPI0007C6DAD3|nr:PP2C family protein-serine/threonine phosphatase [Frankia sp. AvcI1]
MSDRGLVHRTNEDGFALRVLAGPGDDDRPAATLAAVCDGVSTAPGSGPAAVRAARDAVDLLAQLAGTLTVPPATPPHPGDATDTSDPRLSGNAPSDAPGDAPGGAGGVGAGGETRPLGPRPGSASPGGDTARWQASALRAAAATAQRSALASISGPDDAPACTFVAAVVTPDRLSVGWLGDSRAYLIDRSGARLLTADDTLAAEAVRAGLLPPERAETGPGAHTITHWLGVGSASAVPRVAVTALNGPGRVVLCSDGLWNYLSAAGAVAERIAELPAEAPALAVARHLTTVALARGGGDNITVIVIDIPGSSDDHLHL